MKRAKKPAPVPEPTPAPVTPNGTVTEANAVPQLPQVNCRIEVDVVNNRIDYKVLLPDGKRITYFELKNIFLRLAEEQDRRMIIRANLTGAIWHAEEAKPTNG